jgi:hypothetical protein
MLIHWYNFRLLTCGCQKYNTENYTIRKRKANWIGQTLRRNCLLQRVIEEKIQGGIEVTGRQGIRRRKLLDDLKERRGYSHLKEEDLDRTIWRARFGRGFAPVVRQTTKWMNEWMYKHITIKENKLHFALGRSKSYLPLREALFQWKFDHAHRQRKLFTRSLFRQDDDY